MYKKILSYVLLLTVSIGILFAQVYTEKDALDDTRAVDECRFEYLIKKYSFWIEKYPSNYINYRCRGNSYYLQGLYKNIPTYFDSALVDLNKSISLNTTEDYCYRIRGDVYIELKLYDNAITDYSHFLQMTPNEADVYKNRGDCYVQFEKYDLALADFNKAIQLEPNNGNYYLNRGSVYYDQKQYQLALNDYFKALSVLPQKDTSNLSRAYINIGVTYSHMDERAKAKESYLKALKILPTDITAQDNLEILIDLDPPQEFEQGNALYAKGDFTGAIVLFTKAIGSNPSHAKSHNNRGLCYVQISEYDKAIKDCDRTLELNPYFANGYSLRGACYYYKNEFDKAVADKKKALELRPDFYDFKLSYADVLIYKKDYSEALKICQDAQKSQPDDPKLHIRLAKILYNLTRYSEAKTEGLAALPGDPSQANYWLALIATAQKQYGQSIPYYQVCLKLDSANAGFYCNNLGWAYYKLGEYGKAVEAYQKGINAKDSSIDSVYFYGNLAAVYLTTGKKAKMKEMYQKSIAIKPDINTAPGWADDEDWQKVMKEMGIR